MEKHEVMIVANYSQESWLTFDEVCRICNISSDALHELIAYEIIRPRQSTQGDLLFNLVDLHRTKTALRLQRDLEVNIAGVALVLDLLDELEELRAEAKFFDRG